MGMGPAETRPNRPTEDSYSHFLSTPFPLTVKPPVAARYGVDSVMPEATRQGVEDIEKGEIQKRKNVWEGPLKKQKKLSAAREEKGDDPLRSVAINNPSYPLTALTLEKEREAEKLAKAEAERQAAG
jgi:bromodomain adjacent to zinc finger domain protein 1A